MSAAGTLAAARAAAARVAVASASARAAMMGVGASRVAAAAALHQEGRVVAAWVKLKYTTSSRSTETSCK